MRRTHILGGLAALLIAGAGVALLDGNAGNDAAVSRADSDSFATAGAAAGGGRASVAQGYSEDAAVGVGAPNAKDALAAPSGPRIVKTASLTVSVDKGNLVREATAKANTIAERHGGYVSATEVESGDDASSNLTLRVPAAAYEVALGELRGLGEVSNESLGGNDVTATLVDLDARLRSLRAQEGALNALMAKAASVGETLQVAQAVADVRMQIEQLAGQQKALADQADFATITLRVVGPGGAINPTPSPDPVLVKAFDRAAGAALEVLAGVIVVAGVALPTGLLAALGYAVVRMYRRRTAAVA
ncbi:MAG: DUF4349 domain-containing protein [Acidimicrobiales bacterium]|nr:DUF4349 domain-containing protein [Acidimicrobiales bacterium]